MKEDRPSAKKETKAEGRGQDKHPTFVKPGQKTPQSGIYRPTKGGSEVALSKGDRVPPTKAGGGFLLRAATKRGASKSLFKVVRQVGGDWTGEPPPRPPKSPK